MSEALERAYETQRMTDEMSDPTQTNFNLTDFSKLIEFLVEDKSIKQEIKDYFWAFADKELAITNFEKKDIQTIMEYYGITKLSALMTMPTHKYNFKRQTDFHNLAVKTFMKSKRSTGGFERRIQATQIREVRTENEGRAQKKNLLSRLFGFGGGQR